MTINPVSTGTNMFDQVKQLRQVDTQKLAGDISARKDHMAQMIKDLDSGDVAGAKQELAAVHDAQKNIKSDRSTLSDLQSNAQTLHSDVVQRSQDINDYKTAVQNHDWSGAKQAMQAVIDMHSQILTDVQQLRTDQGPTPISVLA